MASNFTQKDFDKIMVLYQHLVQTSPLYQNMSQSQMNYVARIIGNTVHDLTKIWSGYISNEALRQMISDNNDQKITHDHYLSRLQSGKQIVQYFNNSNNISFDEFLNLIFEACYVHKITKSENSKLIQHQNTGTAWYTCYTNAKIDLIYVGDEEGKLPKRLTKAYLKRFGHLIQD